jgi:hypothetical protein
MDKTDDAQNARTDRTAIRKEKFIRALKGSSSITKACKASGVPRRTAYDWKAADKDFAQKWDDAYEEGTDVIEDAVFTRAVYGVKKPVFYKGEIVGYTQEYSDFLAARLLEARRPEKYRHNHPAQNEDPTETASKVRQAMKELDDSIPSPA